MRSKCLERVGFAVGGLAANSGRCFFTDEAFSECCLSECRVLTARACRGWQRLDSSHGSGCRGTCADQGIYPTPESQACDGGVLDVAEFQFPVRGLSKSGHVSDSCVKILRSPFISSRDDNAVFWRASCIVELME